MLLLTSIAEKKKTEGCAAAYYVLCMMRFVVVVLLTVFERPVGDWERYCDRFGVCSLLASSCCAVYGFFTVPDKNKLQFFI